LVLNKAYFKNLEAKTLKTLNNRLSQIEANLKEKEAGDIVVRFSSPGKEYKPGPEDIGKQVIIVKFEPSEEAKLLRR
jgi:hypothetical protein